MPRNRLEEIRPDEERDETYYGLLLAMGEGGAVRLPAIVSVQDSMRERKETLATSKVTKPCHSIEAKAL